MQLWNKRYSAEYLCCWRMVMIYPILPKKSTSTSSGWWLQSMSLWFLRRESIRPLDLQDTCLFLCSLKIVLLKESSKGPLHSASAYWHFSSILVATGACVKWSKISYFHAEQLAYQIMTRVRTSVPAGSPTDSLQVWVSRWRNTRMPRLIPVWSFRSLSR